MKKLMIGTLLVALATPALAITHNEQVYCKRQADNARQWATPPVTASKAGALRSIHIDPSYDPEKAYLVRLEHCVQVAEKNRPIGMTLEQQVERNRVAPIIYDKEAQQQKR